MQRTYATETNLLKYLKYVKYFPAFSLVILASELANLA